MGIRRIAGLPPLGSLLGGRDPDSQPAVREAHEAVRHDGEDEAEALYEDLTIISPTIISEESLKLDLKRKVKCHPSGNIV